MSLVKNIKLKIKLVKLAVQIKKVTKAFLVTLTNIGFEGVDAVIVSIKKYATNLKKFIKSRIKEK